MTPRIHTSEPAFKPRISQSQAERARGEILPMQPEHPAVSLALWLGIIGAAFALWAVFA